MIIKCIHCENENITSENSLNIVRIGKYYRTSDSTSVQRYQCKKCLKSFSTATLQPCYSQKKRHKNEMLRRLLCSGVSQRRAARLLSLARKTVVRKFIFLGIQAQEILRASNLSLPSCDTIEFDDMETFEHSKCKPLSITLAVEFKTRRILGFEVSQMPAKSILARIAVKKYGPRKDLRFFGRRKLFKDIKTLIHHNALIKSDQNPHYPKDVMRHFPKASHETFKGRRGCIVGQGELKKIGFDPLFSLNHTCAMFRANVNRLFRRTWCTSKKPERLSYHLAIYAVYHNQNLKTA
ncbi:MAG: transposase [Bdellovibrionota bacterium]